MRSNRAITVAACALACGSLLCAAQALAGSFTYKTLRIAGQKHSYASGINDKDQVVGGFEDSGQQFHGFVWNKNAYTQVDGTGGFLTELAGINARGVAAGDYLKAGVNGRIAFTYDIATGEQQMVPINPKFGFYAEGINLEGDMVGLAETEEHKLRGFVAKPNGGHVRLLTFPGSTYSTTAFAINNSGAAVGGYSDTPNADSGYIYQSGTYTSFNPPGSTDTQASVITDDGVIGGNYIDDSGNGQGFIMQGGTFTVIDYPGSKSTSVAAIGPGGEVVGNWQDSSNGNHGIHRAGRHLLQYRRAGRGQHHDHRREREGLAGRGLHRRSGTRFHCAMQGGSEPLHAVGFSAFTSLIGSAAVVRGTSRRDGPGGVKGKRPWPFPTYNK